MNLTNLPWKRAARASTVAIGLSLTLSSATYNPYSPREKAFFADASIAQFVRPGLVFKITDAQIAADGTIIATISITDPQGLPLDLSGVTTPGAVSVSFIAATIPKGQEQYTAYTVRAKTSTINGKSAIQAGADAGGTFTAITDGVYQYKFGTKAPAGYDTTATQTIGAYGSRDLTRIQSGYQLCVYHVQLRA